MDWESMQKQHGRRSRTPAFRPQSPTLSIDKVSIQKEFKIFLTTLKKLTLPFLSKAVGGSEKTHNTIDVFEGHVRLRLLCGGRLVGYGLGL